MGKGKKLKKKRETLELIIQKLEEAMQLAKAREARELEPAGVGNRC